MKPTREQVIAWARESELGFLLGENWMMLEALECFATLAYEAGRKDENEACTKVSAQGESNDLYSCVRYPREGCAVTNKILTKKEWRDSVQQIWDQAIRDSIEDQIREAVLAEREACAKVCEELGYYAKHGGWGCADAIRERGAP